MKSEDILNVHLQKPPKFIVFKYPGFALNSG